MANEAIFGPFVGMLLLTFVVWVVMYIRRLRFIFSHRINAQDLTTPDKGARIIPEEVHWSAYNFRNLFELPVIFYALCVYLFVTGQVDEMYVIAGWVFLALRVVHSAIHCTVNIVKLRFISYMMGALTLWFMVLRAALDLFR